MSPWKSMLWMLAAVTAIGVGTALVGHGAFGPSGPSAASDGGTRVVGGRSPEGVLPESRRHADATRPASAPAPSAEEGEPDAQQTEEVRWTETALESWREVAEPGVGSAPAPSEAGAAQGFGAAAAALCSGEGLECRSSADCCPGLACAGGVAGYGTSGRCAAAPD